MLHKTRGVVFRFTKYGETSIIVTLFTELFGLQTYIVNGARSRTSKVMALYQPLTLLDLVVYHKENASILRIKEAKCAYHYTSLITDIRKSTQALFLIEIINKAVKEQSHTQDICAFLFDSLETLDRTREGYENFHLVFLIKLSRFLGFAPQEVSELLSGRYLNPEEQLLLGSLLQNDYVHTTPMTNEHRRTFLDLLLHFYTTHLGAMGEVRSVQILREILE